LVVEFREVIGDRQWHSAIAASFKNSVNDITLVKIIYKITEKVKKLIMSLLGNIIWLIFGGFLAGIGYIFGGILACLTIIGIPFGQQAIKLGIATMTPFGREIVPTPEAGSTLNMILNIVWILVIGWGIAVTHLTSAAILAVTIIGIPFALQHIKLIPLALFPFGRELR
jgi:uncharacterized membrane protein YccF (DUF307 family)